MCKETKRRRITILFGAGASIPFFTPPLTTEYLTDKVLEIKSWEDILKIYAEGMHLEYDFQIPSASVILEVLYRIKNIYQRHGKKINFEQLAEIIDKISSTEDDFAPDSNMLNLLLHTINARPMNLPCWKNVPLLFREIIARSIIDLQRSHKVAHFDALIESQHKLLRTICGNYDDVSVVSLNYDDCVYESCYELGLDKCFKSIDHTYTRQIEVKDFMRTPRVLYFPHGNIRFQFDNKEQAIWYPAQELAEFERWYNIDATFAGRATKTKFQGTFAYNYNTFISTGQTKEEWLNRLPFAVYYQRLAIDFAKSNTIYIIGYSFGDSHINRLLGSFLRLSRENSLYIVDLYKKDVNDISKSGKHEGIMQNISRFFKTFFIPFYLDDADAVHEHMKELEEVNDKEYGKIADQVIFYKKGYESFLDEYEAVITEDYRKPRCKFIQGCIDKVNAVIKLHNK